MHAHVPLPVHGLSGHECMHMGECMHYASRWRILIQQPLRLLRAASRSSVTYLLTHVLAHSLTYSYSSRSASSRAASRSVRTVREAVPADAMAVHTLLRI